MNLVAVIPARASSTRLPNKPLADICGRPMVWWTHKRCIDTKVFSRVIVATEDQEIVNACQGYGIEALLTRSDHPNKIYRVHEVSRSVAADYYVCVNGDEPLTEAANIMAVIPASVDQAAIVTTGLMTDSADAVGIVDPTNIKVVATASGRCLFQSRAPVPLPHASLDYRYQKYVGIEGFNRRALDFYTSTPMGPLERIEAIDQLRFLEHGHSFQVANVSAGSISVDTPKDLAAVRQVIAERIAAGIDPETGVE